MPLTQETPARVAPGPPPEVSNRNSRETHPGRDCQDGRNGGSFLNFRGRYHRLMTARDPVSQIIARAGIEEMTSFERACFVVVATSSMILVVAGMAFLLL